jgi:hypothetical protein
MRMSRDVVFDEFHHFYLCPSFDASPISLVDPLTFLLFPYAPPAPLPISLSTLLSSVSSSESSLVVLDYTVKPPVTQFYSRRGAHLLDAPPFSDELSFDVSSSSFVEDIPSSPSIEPSSPIDSSPEQLIRRSRRLRRPPNYYSPSAFIATTLSESASYHDAILHLEWQHMMAEEIAVLERTGTWDFVPYPPPPTCSSDHLQVGL